MTRTRVLPPLDTPGLTPAEARILKLAHDGHSDSEIEALTGLAYSTVKSYIQNARDKGRDAVYRILNARAR